MAFDHNESILNGAIECVHGEGVPPPRGRRAERIYNAPHLSRKPAPVLTTLAREKLPAAVRDWRCARPRTPHLATRQTVDAICRCVARAFLQNTDLGSWLHRAAESDIHLHQAREDVPG